LHSNIFIDMYIKLLLLTIIILAIAFVRLRPLKCYKKDGEFKKQCSTVDPHTGKNLGCTCSGAPSDGSCRNDDEVHDHKHHHVSPTLAKIKELQTD